MTAAILSLITACRPIPDQRTEEESRFRLSAEEAGFVTKGELFRIYGVAADPVIVDVDATEDTIDGKPVWHLGTRVHVLVDGQVQERRRRFWIAPTLTASPPFSEDKRSGDTSLKDSGAVEEDQRSTLRSGLR